MGASGHEFWRERDLDVLREGVPDGGLDDAPDDAQVALVWGGHG